MQAATTANKPAAGGPDQKLRQNGSSIVKGGKKPRMDAPTAAATTQNAATVTHPKRFGRALSFDMRTP